MTETKIVELIINEENESLAIDCISLVSEPAIEENLIFMSKAKNNLTLAKIDTDKREIISPALIPNKNIYRVDENGDDYYVYFSKDTVKNCAYSFLKNNNHHKATYQHQERVSGVLTVESWIIEDPKMDKANLYGFQLKKGTEVDVSLNLPSDEDNLKHKIIKHPINSELNGDLYDIMAKLFKSIIGIGVIIPGKFKR